VIGPAVFLLAVGAAHAASAERTASVTVVAPLATCVEAKLGTLAARPGPDGAFEFEVELAETRTYRLECGGKFEIDLAPADRLTITLDAAGKIRFSGRGSAANDYMNAPAALSIAVMTGLAPKPRAAFVASWQALLDRDLVRLKQAERDGAPRDFLDRETVRLRFRWAQGRVMFPFFHWRETNEESIVPDPALPGILKSLPIEDPRWWGLREHQDLLDAHLHARARERLESVPELRKGDNRWLRAKLAVLPSEVASSPLRLRETTRLIAKHVEDDGSKGIDPILERWMSLSPDAESVKRVRDLVAADRARRDGHPVRVYREVGGVPLELHLLEPAGPRREGPRPAMLWIHGGSATEGTWWWSPVITQALLDEGILVAAVELTTGNRFDADADQFEDASAAYVWLKAHAAEFAVDPTRIGVAGFSSGASVALLLATRGVSAGQGGGSPSGRERPAALVTMSGCADPSEDAWFRKTMAREHRSPADFSPLALVGPGQPPVLAVHATADEYCPYADMQRFVERYVAAGNDGELISVREVGHFFGFYYPPGQRQTREAIAAALKRWGWSR